MPTPILTFSGFKKEKMGIGAGQRRGGLVGQNRICIFWFKSSLTKTCVASAFKLSVWEGFLGMFYGWRFDQNKHYNTQKSP